eukprot:TRINITY_DN18296_c0_g2_i1.p1 TRINITY_DN18296_c0_g2~~TRINITY_DN18296_c0_g2_i1.p1  ORF type:complete len:776 (+),score=200.61 TRINITY_DN18296_c0_g2_i1:88-2415(+)
MPRHDGATGWQAALWAMHGIPDGPDASPPPPGAASAALAALSACTAEELPDSAFAAVAAAVAAVVSALLSTGCLHDEHHDFNWAAGAGSAPEALGCLPQRVRTDSLRTLRRLQERAEGGVASVAAAIEPRAAASVRSISSIAAGSLRFAEQVRGHAALMHETMAKTLSPLLLAPSEPIPPREAAGPPPPEPVVEVHDVTSFHVESGSSDLVVQGCAGSPTHGERFRFRVPFDVGWAGFAEVLQAHASPLLPQTVSTSAYWDDGEGLLALRCEAHLRAFADDARRRGGVGRVVVLPRPDATSPGSALASPATPPPDSVIPGGSRAGQAHMARAVTQWTKGRLLGRGTFGTVYQAIDNEDGRIIAVKQIELPSEAAAGSDLQQLREEIELLRSVQHRNVVQYLGTQQDHQAIYIFMEYMAGGSLAALARQYGGRAGGLHPRVIQNYTRQILDGLVYLHQVGIVHRDIKGDNILCEGASGIVKLADFGAAKRLQQVATVSRQCAAQHSGLKGTVFFLSPEVIRGKPYSHASDVWALGCTVVEMATGSPPWRDCRFNHELQVLYYIAQSNEGPQLPSGVLPPSGDDFLRQCFTEHTQRPLAARLLEHPFLSDACSGLSPEPLSPAARGSGPSEMSSMTWGYSQQHSGAPPMMGSAVTDPLASCQTSPPATVAIGPPQPAVQLVPVGAPGSEAAPPGDPPPPEASSRAAAPAAPAPAGGGAALPYRAQTESSFSSCFTSAPPTATAPSTAGDAPAQQPPSEGGAEGLPQEAGPPRRIVSL